MKLNSTKSIYKATEKLVADQHHKYKYVLHYRLLKLFVRLGMIVRRMHSVQWFKQSSWLKSYIDFNTEKRKNAKTDFEKDLFKLMNNAVYGKTMEDVKNRVNIKFVPKDDSEKCMKEVSKLSFNRFKEFDNYNAYHHTKQLVKLDKPMYLGAAILDLSKLSMYDDFYNKFQPYWGIDNLQMHYTDTDSMNLSFWTPDLNNDLEYFKDHFDFSNAPKDHPLYNKSNEKVIGKQKLELWDKPKEAVFIRSKMYSHCLPDKDKLTLKGFNKTTVSKMNHDDFKSVLLENGKISGTNYSINHKLHNMQVNKLNKTTDTFDDKMYYVGGKTFPHGYVNVH